MSGECKHHQTSIWMDLSHEALQFLVSSRCYGSAHHASDENVYDKLWSTFTNITHQKHTDQTCHPNHDMLAAWLWAKDVNLVDNHWSHFACNGLNPLAFQASLRNWAESNSSSQQSYSSFDLIPFISKDGTEFCRN